MHVVAGLGNPGERYRRTRHNAGFLAIDVLLSLARTIHVGRLPYFEAEVRSFAGPDRLATGEALAWVAEATFSERLALLMKPLAFMNRSGAPIARLLASAGASPADLVVIVDDVALELGTIRVRERGSDGGHNGLRSLIAELGTEEFARVRVGIAGGELPVDLAEYVLSEVPQGDAPLFDQAVRLAADAVECILVEGTAVAMNRFNSRRV